MEVAPIPLQVSTEGRTMKKVITYASAAAAFAATAWAFSVGATWPGILAAAAGVLAIAAVLMKEQDA